MKIRTIAKTAGLFLAAMMLAGLSLTGCSNDTTPVAAVPTDDTTSLELIADPVSESLDATAGGAPHDARGRIDRLAEILGLDADQTAAMMEAYDEFRAGVEELRSLVRSGELTYEEARIEAALLRDELEAALQVILTAEQWEQFLEMREHNQGTVHGYHNAQDRWNAWLDAIGADAEQVEAVLAALDIFHDGMADLREQVHAGDLTRQEAREQAQWLREEFDLALQQILTLEQYEALQELRPDCPGRHARR